MIVFPYYTGSAVGCRSEKVCSVISIIFRGISLAIVHVQALASGYQGADHYIIHDT